MRWLWKVIARTQPAFEVGDDVEFTSGDMLCPEGTKLVVEEVIYYPFGYFGTILNVKPAEYRYSVTMWDSRLFTDVRECHLAKREN